MKRSQSFGPLVRSVQSVITMSQNYCRGMFLCREGNIQFQLNLNFNSSLHFCSRLFLCHSCNPQQPPPPTSKPIRNNGELWKSCKQWSDKVKTAFKFTRSLHITVPLLLYFFKFLIVVQLIFNAVNSIEQSSLCCTVGDYQLSTLYTAVCICQSQSPNSFLPLVTISLFSASVTPFLFCKQVHLYHFFRFHI